MALPHVTPITPCGAKTRSGLPCKLPPMANGRCKYHGGKSLAGVASPLFVDGRHSKYMPKRLLDKYSKAMNDPRVTKYEDDFALVETLIADRLEQIDTGETAKLWQESGKSATLALKLLHEKKYFEARIEVENIHNMTAKAARMYEAIESLISLFEQKRKLRDSYQRYLVQAGQVMTMEQTMALIAALTDTVRKHVTDKQALNAISADLASLVTAKVS